MSQQLILASGAMSVVQVTPLRGALLILQCQLTVANFPAPSAFSGRHGDQVGSPLWHAHPGELDLHRDRNGQPLRQELKEALRVSPAPLHSTPMRHRQTATERSIIHHEKIDDSKLPMTLETPREQQFPGKFVKLIIFLSSG